jgi:uncharacterized protein involved in exopolysaccharide biosynthesis
MNNYEQNALLFYLRLLLERKITIISIVIISVTISIIIALMLPSIYQSSVLVAPVSKNSNSSPLSGMSSQLGGLVGIGDIGLSGGDVTETSKSLAYLKSRNFKYQIIKELNLTPLLFKELWNENTKSWRVTEKDVPTLWDAHKEFSELISVDEDKITGLITLSVEWEDPNTAALIVKAMIKRINDELQQDAVQESKVNLEYLYEQVRNTQIVEIKATFNQLIEQELKKSMLANSNVEFAFKIIDPAIIPQERIKPKRSLIVVLGFILGTFASIIYVIMMNAYAIFKRTE